jgi:hypothetical protein
VIIRSSGSTTEFERTLTSALTLAGTKPELHRQPEVNPRDLLTPRQEEHSPLAHVWVDLNDPARAIVYIIDSQWERVLIRFVRRSESNPALDDEQIAQILSSSVEALLNGARIGISRDEARQMLLPPPKDTGSVTGEPRRSSDSSVRLGAALFYELQALSSTVDTAQGPGFSVSFLVPTGPIRWGLAGSAQYAHAYFESDLASARLDEGRMRLLALSEVDLATRWAWRSGFGGGPSFVYLTPNVTASDLEATEARWLVYGMLRAQSGLVYREERVALGVSVAAELDVLDHQMTVELERDTHVLFDPWLIRPSLSLFFGW